MPCIILDIHNFTYINSFFDVAFSDEILKKFSQNLLEQFKKYNYAFIARFKSDEFAIFLEIPENQTNNIETFITEIFEQLNKKIEIHQLEFYLNFHCGIALFPEHSKNARNLINLAQIALKKCKTENIKNIEFYTKTIEERTKLYFLVQQKSNYFQFNNEFFIVFHPYNHIQSKETIGFEILSRWNEPNYGNIPPDQFISIFEKSGLIKSFEIALIEHFIKTYQKVINNEFLKNKMFSLNLSPISFGDPYLMEHIITLFLNSNIPLSSIIIEITESSYIESFDYASQIIQKLKNSGFNIAIDDFGTGYSSLRYILDLNIDFLKIDKIFIQNYNDKKSYTILETITHLSKSLGIKTIAEGIETEKQLELIKQLDINYGQGFLFSKPLLLNQLINKI
ncbi:MAG: hypothetical protein KatS3mg129_0114 [Leptospiraceae bacterium]|nr:MAG: hypothetical protein KatS3mg129_0114 [Leptospiraceae bacterium]